MTADTLTDEAASELPADWPICPLHGPHDSLMFNDDVPEGQCSYCEQNGFRH